MEITEIRIAPSDNWRELSDDNPLKATVKLSSKETTVETVLDSTDMHELLVLVEHIIARAAKRNVEQFIAATSKGSQKTLEAQSDEFLKGAM